MKKVMNGIAVGNEYNRKMGAVRQHVTIVGYDEATKKYTFVAKSGKEGVADAEAIGKWELLKAVEMKKVNVSKRRNELTCLEAAIRTLEKRNVPMNAKELVSAIKEDEMFSFKPTAKTPWNSVGSQLSTYINKCVESGEECRVKRMKRGKFAYKDYVEAVA